MRDETVVLWRERESDLQDVSQPAVGQRQPCPLRLLFVPEAEYSQSGDALLERGREACDEPVEYLTSFSLGRMVPSAVPDG
jgi:hypothetical protein